MRFWVAAGFFFGIAAAGGSAVAGWLLGRGATAATAVGLGATAGAVAAWLVTYLAVRSIARPAGAEPGAAADRGLTGE